MEELRKLLPGEKYFTVTGEEISVNPIPFGKTIEYVDALSALIQKVVASGLDIEKIFNKESGIIVASLFKVAFKEIINLMSIVLEKPKEWFTESIDFSDGCALLEIIIRQNIDNDRAKKNLKSFMGRLRSLLQIPSRSSSAPGIDGQKSKDTQENKSDSSQKVSSSSKTLKG